MTPDLYAVLGVKRTSTKAAIKKAYRRAAMKLHPDRNPGDEKAAAGFKAVQEAWDVLGNDERRRRYDATGEFDLGPDNSLGHALVHLSDAMGAVLNQLIEEQRDPAVEDVVGLMRNALARRREEQAKRLLALQEGKTTLARIAERFQVAEGENDLAAIGRAHMARTEEAMRKIENELTDIGAALELLKRFSFRRDASGMWATTATTAAFSTINLNL